jgi:hypothetical protein
MYNTTASFGVTITTSAGRAVPVRWVGEQHVREDMGRIPTAADWLLCIRPDNWMNNAARLSREFAEAGPRFLEGK